MSALTRKQLRRVKTAFRSFSGPDLLIDYREWKSALGLRNDFLVQRIFNLVDTDGTGFIDFSEFLVFAEYLYADDQRRRLVFFFRIYDLDGNGSIERAEFKRILEAGLAEQSVTLAEEVTNDLVKYFQKQLDLDRDGRISLAEFTEVVGQYPGIKEQFSVYAADWLNEGKGFKSAGVKSAPIAVRVRLGWQSWEIGLLWSSWYVAVSLMLFALTLVHYSEKGAGIALQFAHAAGVCLNLNAALILLPVCRNLWTWVRRTRYQRYFPLDHMTDIHRMIGSAIVVFAVLHIGGHLVSYWETRQPIVANLLHTVVGVTGVAITAILAFMAWYSRRSVISRRHEWFASTHLLYLMFLVGFLLHGPLSWRWLAFPLSLFVVDLLTRWFWKRRKVDIVEMKPLANGVTLVRFKKPRNFRFHPGDYLRLKVRDISRFQWHPFTISAAPEATTIGVHVRNNGDWSGALHNLSRNKALADKRWSAVIDGPYAAPTSVVYRSKVAVLIAAGIGITPFASVLQSIVLQYKSNRGKTAKPDQIIYFHWLNRSQHAYEWFVDLLADAEQTLGSERFKLHIHLTSLTHDLTNIAMQVAMDSYYEHHQRDPMTGLRAETSAGRPDWGLIFNEISQAHPGELVDVHFCGPPALAKIVRKKCSKHGLVYHEEKF